MVRGNVEARSTRDPGSAPDKGSGASWAGSRIGCSRESPRYLEFVMQPRCDATEYVQNQLSRLREEPLEDAHVPRLE